MRLARNDLVIDKGSDEGKVMVQRGDAQVELTQDELRWLLVTAGPAALVELQRKPGG